MLPTTHFCEMLDMVYVPFEFLVRVNVQLLFHPRETVTDGLLEDEILTTPTEASVPLTVEDELTVPAELDAPPEPPDVGAVVGAEVGAEVGA